MDLQVFWLVIEDLATLINILRRHAKGIFTEHAQMSSC